MAADIARLRAAKGIQVRAWLAANRRLALVFLAYLAVVALYGGIAYARDQPIGSGILVGVFFGPIVLLRIALRARRRR
jgi:hypothetical protein